MATLLLAIIYLAFVSLGLPDGLLGSAWPTMYLDLNVPLSYAGIITTILCLGTIVSSLFSHALIAKLGTGKVTLFSTLLTALALLGFALSNSFWLLVLLSIPYGLGAGSIDAALNNYVATHYSSRHMNWLHCMWGLGGTIGPYIMSYALTFDKSWNNGFGYVSIIQIALSVVLLISLPLWKKNNLKIDDQKENGDAEIKPITIKSTFKIKGVIIIILLFFFYCSLEQTQMLWASSYMVLNNGIDTEVAASYAGITFLFITIGRLFSGLLSTKVSDQKLIIIGFFIILIGIIALFIKDNITTTLIGLALINFGCAPIYPCLIHSTPVIFDKKYSQAIIGLEMAFAYIGSCIMPPLFGLLAQLIGMFLLPIFLLIMLITTFITFRLLLKQIK